MSLVERYFSSTPLVGSCVHKGCRAQAGDATGDGVGVQATQWFDVGEEVWSDKPLIFCQSFCSAAVAPACLNCGRLLGNLRHAVKSALAPRGKGLEHYPDVAASPLLDDEKFRLPAPVACPGCREAKFCSVECRDVQLTRGHHRILCAELPAQGRRSWLRFRELARRGHDSFTLAALVIAQIICDVLHSGMTLPDAVARLCNFHSGRWEELKPGREQSRRLRLEKSLQLLKAALGPCGGDAVAELFEFDFYSRLMGMLDLTAVDISRQHCLESRLKAALKAEVEDVNLDFKQIAAEWWIYQEKLLEDMSDSSDDDSPDLGQQEASLLPPFEGIALSRAVALTNHSCYPNVDILCRIGTSEISTRARHPIAPGQQLLMSYGVAGNLAERQRQLRSNYGFYCLCVRCRAEACRDFLDGQGPYGEINAWLERYALDNGMTKAEASHGILQAMPPGLLEEPLPPATMLAAGQRTNLDDGSIGRQLG